MSEVVRAVRNVPLALGLAGVLAIAVIALYGPQLAAADPQAQRVIIFWPDGRFQAPPTPPDELYPLGTDPLGRDQLSRLLWGARLTLGATLLGLALRASIGVLLGTLAGWRRGWVDAVVVWITNAVGGFPQLMLALLIAVALREQGFAGFVLALGLVGWAEIAQFVRTEVVRVRASAYVEAARALGAGGLGLVRRHVLASISPQLAGVLALEAGSVLLLLAELGFIGLFISGGTFYVDDSNRPLLPVRDRAPEWGQMLAGARQYAFSQQYVAFVPGVVVVAAVFAFNLFGEGLRAASDPFGSHRLSPRALAVLGRGLGAAALAGVVLYGAIALRSTELGFADAMARAREAAAREVPGSELVAGIVRFRSSSHALARPEKINFYFRQPGEVTVLRVGFADADANAMEVKRFDVEDELPFKDLRPVGAPAIDWSRALQAAEDGGGRQFRIASPAWVVRVSLVDESEEDPPIYRVVYGRPNLESGFDYAIDAATGSADPIARVRDAERRAAAALGGPVRLASVSASWRWTRSPALTAFGTDRPIGLQYTFVPAAAADRSVTIAYDASRGTVPIVRVQPQFAPRVPDVVPDVMDAFRRVEDAGGRAVHEEWEQSGVAEWFASANTVSTGAHAVALFYQSQGMVVRFTYFADTGEVRRQ